MTESDGKSGPKRRLVLLIVALTAICGLALLVPAIIAGWLGGSFLGWIPAEQTVAAATNEIEQQREPIIDNLEAQVELVSRQATDFATRGDLIDGPSSSSDDVSCGIGLVAHGFSINSVTYFSSPDMSVQELLVRAEEVLIERGFEASAEQSSEAVADEIVRYIAGGEDGPRPSSLDYRLDAEDMQAVLRYDGPGDQLALVLDGPCYRRTG